jgi:hypothetical protein
MSQVAVTSQQFRDLETVLRVIYQRIQDRAYELYLQQGRQPGRALDNWLQAEAELLKTKAAA